MPSYTKARECIYSMLDGWTFCRVERDATIPREDTDSGYYHFMATSIKNEENNSKTRVWCKKTTMAGTSLPLRIGPVMFSTTDPDYVVRARDIIVGKIVERKQPKQQEGGASSTKKPRTRYELVSWYPQAKALLEFYDVLVNGTKHTESQLAHKLRIYNNNEANDDLWAVMRLVMFGNVAVFAAMAKENILQVVHGRPMQLRTSATSFIRQCAKGFCDQNIWKDFIELVPEAEEENTIESVRPYEQTFCNSVYRPTAYKPFQPFDQPFDQPTQPNKYRKPAETTSTSSGYLSYTPNSPRYTPNSPRYTPNSPRYTPNSPRYSPNPPAYSPTSPVYTPTSPVYTPTSPVYTPTSPVYTPNSPPYTPNSPVYTPNSPIYSPNSPVCSAKISIDKADPPVYAPNSSSYVAKLPPDIFVRAPKPPHHVPNSPDDAPKISS